MRVIKVLYLEDDPEDQEIFRDALKAKKYQYIVDVTDKVGVARAMLRSTPYDVIFCDLRLPGGESGADFLIELTQTGYSARLVAITGMDQQGLDEKLQELIRAHQVVFLPKGALAEESVEDTIEVILSQEINVLYLDDNELDVEMAEGALEMAKPLKFNVVHAQDEATAQELLEAGKWDVLLVDWYIGSGKHITAEHFLRHVLADEQMQTSIVLLTGQGEKEMPAEIQRCLGRRSIGYFPKGGLNTSKLVSSIISQRNNRRIPQLQ